MGRTVGKIPPNIAVLGSLHMDVVVRAARQPRLGETLAGQSWRPAPGGKGLNQAAHAAHHGANVRMIGRVGNDDFSGPLRTYMADHNVDGSTVRADPHAGTGMSVAIIEDSGDYAAVIVSGANQCLDQGEVDAIAATPIDILLLQYEVASSVLAAAARAAQRAGARVILNAAPAMPAPPGLLEAVDLLIVNEIEAEMLTGIPVNNNTDAVRAISAARQLVQSVIITLGPAGALIVDGDVPPVAFPGHNVDIVDTHGAGDAFIGALAYRLGLGENLTSATCYANAAAAAMVSSAGADPWALQVDQVHKLLGSQTN